MEEVERFSSLARADVARGLLVEHGIEAEVLDEGGGRLHPDLVAAGDGALLMVSRDEADRARELLAENRRPPESEAGVAAGSSRPVRWVALGAVLLLLVVLGLSLLPDLL